ncbi:MAG: polyketide synthase module [Nitrospira sp.]|jgi:amino acid adenylation domain-containing protein/non-ribosomal peptide synthase protein (TIGR01720 family)|nr:MAG: polyketide synthase module [Nitrospira sp.]
MLEQKKRAADRPELSAAKKALLQKLLEGKVNESADSDRICRRSRPHEPAPLSFAQQRLWFLDQLEPNSHFYNVPVAFGISGALNLTALQQSIDAILLRHESLRSVITENNGQPVQTAMAYSPLAIKHVDLRRLGGVAQESELQRLMTQEFQQPFDLTKGPLFRSMLLRLEDRRYVLLLTMHHIVTDDWSMGLLFRELAASYQSFTDGTPVALPEDGVQYADYAVWQRQRLSSTILEKQLTYWKDKLRGVPTILKLPTDRPRPSVQTYQGDDVPFTLTESLTVQLSEFSRKQGVTLFMTLLAAFEVLLSRYSDQKQFCIGTPLANRTRPEVENLIGFFVNTLVLRADLTGDPTFVEHLANVREASLEAQSHQDIPFEKLLDELQPTRDLAYSPLFQVMFVLHNVPRQGIQVSGLEFYPVDMKEKSAPFDLCLDMTERGGRLSGEFQYSTALFDGETIARMAEHFRILLEAIVVGPQARIAELPMLTGTELRQVLKEWNTTETDYPTTQTISQLFEAQVARTPTAVAVKSDHQQVTYEELNARANQLARYLREQGVGPDVLVGLYVERSLEMVIGLLGILKAGGAYVPLDPHYPTERLAYMLVDSRPAIVLTQAHLQATIPARDMSILCLDSQWEVIATYACMNLVPVGQPEQLAYVIYTSGSTGRPKGISVTHRSLVNHGMAMVTMYGLSPDDRVLQFSSISFDVLIEECIPTWLTGATVVLRSSESTETYSDFHAFIRETNITVLNLPTPYWAGWIGHIEHTDAAMPPALRLVVAGSEKAAVDDVRRWRRIASDAIGWCNAYGPTETTVTASVYAPDSRTDWLPMSTVPIGRPIANVELYVLDSDLQPVPLGAVGELYIAGTGLARGYLNRPNLTAAAFGPHPFSEQPGQRLYRTGDLGRYRADGTLEFLGRRDQQVKVRGFRIELGEIEARLREHPAIGQAVVVARAEPAGSKRLVGYLVTTAPVAVAAVREFLGRRLPEYMVPAVYVVLDKLPLTPNGKVDRKALPAPEAGGGEARLYVAPRTEFETTLAAIWRQVLRVERVGIHDNFFELGGDSILSIQVIAQARERGIRVTPRQLFQHQTVAALAAVSTGKPAEAEREGPVQGAVPLTPIQQDFFAQGVANPHYYNQAVLLAVQPAVDLRRLEHAVQAVLAHHDAFRLRFTPTADGWRQAYAAEAAAVTVEYVDLAAVPVAEQAQALEAAATDRQARLDLTTGPVVRAVLFTRGPAQTARLLLVIHHLVVDGISWRILLEDLMTAYQALTTQAPVRLPTSSSFQAWATQLHAYSHSAALQAEAASWLAIEPAAAWAIPVEDPQGAATEADAEIVTVSVDAETTRQLVQAVPAAARTQLHEVLLAALVQVLSEWSGSAVVAFDLEGHGREDVFPELDVSRTVGWFTTVYPVVVRVAPGATPGAVLAAVKARVRRLPHKGLGYGLLRYGGGDPEVRRHLAAQPPAPVSFNYLGQLDQTFPPEAPVRPAPESVGPNQAAGSRLPYEWDINAHILDGRLHVLWGYSGRRYRRATMAALGERYEQALRTLIRECLAGEAAGYTPADFPDVELSPEALNHILEDIQ